MIARLSADMTAFTLADPKDDRGPAWRGTYPVAALPAKLAFYRWGEARMGGKFARDYTPTVQALVALQRQLAARA